MIFDLISLAIFVLIAAVTFILVQALARLQQDPLQGRLAAASTGVTSGTGNEGLVSGLAEQLPQTSMDNGNLDRELRRAGYYQRDARKYYLAIRNGLVLGVLMLTGLVVVALGPEQQSSVYKVLGVGCVLAFVCWSLPRVLLHFAGERRVDRIRRGLPDALDMLTMCLTGGLSIQKGLDHVSHEIYLAHPDLAVEFYIVKKQTEMISLESAFQRFADRVDIPEVATLSSLVLQGQRLGTDVSTTVRTFADDLRSKRRQLANERANKAVVKLLFPTIVCLLPAVFIVLWGPAVLELTDFLSTFEGASDITLQP